MSRPATRQVLQRGAWLAAAVSLACVAAVAQPTATKGPTSPSAPPPLPVAPAEEAPPAVATPPAPILTPPLSPAEVSAAPPQVTASTAAPAAPEAPAHRARFDVAVLQAIDKITAETLRFEAAVGRPVRYKGLIFTVRACERSAPDEPISDSIAYVTIDSQPRATPGRPTPSSRQAFKGWMYASSPGLNPLEHPVYDAWLISCRARAPLKPAAAAAPVAKTAPSKPADVAATPAAPAPNPTVAEPKPAAPAAPAPKPASPPPTPAAPTPAAPPPAAPPAEAPPI